MKSSIQVEEVIKAQALWSKNLIAIGQAKVQGGDYRQKAQDMLEALYGYHLDDAVVLFKPTRAVKVPFRPTFKGALSYFIGENSDFPEDKGFALEPWVDVVFDNHGFYFYEDMCIAMGEYTFTNLAQDKAKVEYTFGYIKDANGLLKIVVHHSSFPASGH
mgnify:CR=1 FL=1